MIAVIDNYDSFTYNLVQFLGELVDYQAARTAHIRTDDPGVAQRRDRRRGIGRAAPSHIVISPGPGTPEQDSGISNDVIRVLGSTTPILGVCLGQQCMGTSLAGRWCARRG